MNLIRLFLSALCISSAPLSAAAEGGINTVEDFYLNCRPDMQVGDTTESAYLHAQCVSIVKTIASVTGINGDFYGDEEDADSYRWGTSACFPDGTTFASLMQSMRNYAERNPTFWNLGVGMFMFAAAEEYPCPP